MKTSVDMLTEFRTFLEKENVAPRTQRAYEADVIAFVHWFETTTGESFDPAALTRREMLDWREAMLKSSKPASVNRRLCSLRAFFDWAILKGLVSIDPTRRLRGVKVAWDHSQAPTDDTIERILQQARLAGNLRDRAILELMAATGLHVHELAGLRGADLELGPTSASVTVANEKTGGSRRVPVSVRARAVLREYLETRGEIPAGQPLFPSRLGKPVSPYTIWYLVKKYAGLAGVEAVSPRNFREAAALRLLRDPQMDLSTAATLLGHIHPESSVHYLQTREKIEP